MSGGHNVLVLNADFRPLSYFPLSVCSWQEAVKALFLGRVNVVENYDKTVSSPSLTMQIPSVIVLKEWVMPQTQPPFTRHNLMLRDNFCCQYCGKEGFIYKLRSGVRLNLDHVIPKSRGGDRSWDNLVASCTKCNTKKADKTPKEASMPLKSKPKRPSTMRLWKNSLALMNTSGRIPEAWRTYLLPDEEGQGIPLEEKGN